MGQEGYPRPESRHPPGTAPRTTGDSHGCGPTRDAGGLDRDATLFPSGRFPRGMKDYIVDQEQHLSPVVVVTTALLAVIFVLGVLFQLLMLIL